MNKSMEELVKYYIHTEDLTDAEFTKIYDLCEQIQQGPWDNEEDFRNDVGAETGFLFFDPSNGIDATHSEDYLPAGVSSVTTTEHFIDLLLETAWCDSKPIYYCMKDTLRMAASRLYDGNSRLYTAVAELYGNGWTADQLQKAWEEGHGGRDVVIFSEVLGVDSISYENIPRLGTKPEIIDGEEMLDLILAKVAGRSIHEVCVSTRKISTSQMESLLKIFTLVTGEGYWKDAEHFLMYSRGLSEHYSFYSSKSGIDGHNSPQGLEIGVDEFIKLFLKHLGIDNTEKSLEDIIAELTKEGEEVEENTFEVEEYVEEYLPNPGFPPEGNPYVKIVCRNGQTFTGPADDMGWRVDENHPDNWDLVKYMIVPRVAKVEAVRDDVVAPVYAPKPRYRKTRQKPPVGKKPVVRILYTTQQTYMFKNVDSVQVTGEKVYIQYARNIAEGIVESVVSEIDSNLLLAVVIEENGHRDNFLANIDGSWDYQGHDGTAVKGGKLMGRQFLSK